MRSIRLFINGQWRAGARGRTLEVINPATEQAVAQLCLADEDDIADAIKAAAAGFETWRGVSAVDRATILKKIADGLRRDVDAIARVLTEEQGKPLEQSRIEIATTAAYFEELRRY